MDPKTILASAATALLAAAALLPAPTAAEFEPALPTCAAGPLYDLEACTLRVQVEQAEPGAPVVASFQQGRALSCSGADQDAAAADAGTEGSEASGDSAGLPEPALDGEGEVPQVVIQPVDFGVDLECSPLHGTGTFEASTCVAVAAGTDTSGPASASASSSCGELSASCSSSTGLFEAEHCHDEDTGSSSGGWRCTLRISWTPGLGSASAWCSVSAS